MATLGQITKGADTLTREFDGEERAANYAERIAAVNGPLSDEYAAIARVLRARVAASLPAKESRALHDIRAILSGNKWTADTCEEIAQVIRATGRTIEDAD